MKTTLQRYIQPATIVIWGLVCFCFFQFFYKYHFFYQEQSQLFLLSGEYIQGYFARPAWLACLLGDFFTQFYYYLYAGPALLTGALLVLGDALRRDFQKTVLKRWAFPLAMVCMTVVAWLCLDDRFRLSSVVALAGGCVAFWLTPQLKNRFLCSVLGFCMTLFCYWCFGIGALLYALLTLLTLTSKSAVANKWIVASCSVLAIALISLAKPLYRMSSTDLYTYPGKGALRAPQLLTDRSLGIACEYGLGNYDKVVAMVEKEEQPTQDMKFYYNLVMAQRGELPDHLLKWQNNELGTFYKIGPSTPQVMTNNLYELYWALGDMTFTERAAMLACVFSPNKRNIKTIRRLAEVNLTTGEQPAADKYLRLLSQTWVYKDWAKRALAGDRSILKPYRDKALFCNKADTLQTEQNTHWLMMQLLDSNPHNVVALDYLLCSDLLLKDIETFHKDYDRYCIAPNNERIKPLYQEALCIYLAGTNAQQKEWERYIKSSEVLERFREYNQQRGSAQFAGTYWYYFDTADNYQLSNTK